jgi:hypothetical protein
MEGKRCCRYGGFGIIRDAALYAGHWHATVKLFTDLWDKKQELALPSAISA